jgi:glutamate carboxypeptidase
MFPTPPPPEPEMPEIVAHFESRGPALVELIRALVERETTSREEARLGEIARFIADLLVEIGGEVRLIVEPGFGTHLQARFFDRAFPPLTKRLLVIGHLDTVWPIGTLARLPFRITPDGKAHGPGIFDMKSGVAMAVEALRAFTQLGLEPSRPVTLLLTCDEEIGSRSSRPLIEEEASRAAAALVLEPPIPGGIVKTARKGIGVFAVRAIGRAAHAGLDPARGVNAIVELAHQTLRLAGLNNAERGTTVSVGVVSGGTASNVVPAEASARVDVRFWESPEGERIDAAIRALTPVLPEARLEITGGINRPPMPRSARNIALYEHARDLAAELGFELKDGSVGGGSDGNFTAALGVPTLDGLGVDGAGAHAEHEHIILADLPRRAALLTRLMQTV